jgi:hypothetical protein
MILNHEKGDPEIHVSWEREGQHQVWRCREMIYGDPSPAVACPLPLCSSCAHCQFTPACTKALTSISPRAHQGTPFTRIQHGSDAPGAWPRGAPAVSRVLTRLGQCTTHKRENIRKHHKHYKNL